MPYVTNTHSIVWHMTDDPKLSINAKRIFQKEIMAKIIFLFPVLSFLNYFIVQKKEKLTLILVVLLQ